MTFYVGDIHLGYERKSFTTKAGRARYKTALYEVAQHYCTSAAIQVGDMFDKHRTDDLTAVRGATLMKGLGGVLAGNHDLINSRDELSTLGLLTEQRVADSVMPTYDQPYTFKLDDLGEVVNTLVPYCYTQELFEQSLDLACKEAFKDEVLNVLVIHANYNSPWELTETTNNLTKEKAKELLEHFDYIVSGHEHNYAEHLGGRLIMTGSVMPLSSEEYTDKYVVEITPEGVQKHKIWDSKLSCGAYDVNDAPQTLPEGIQFVHIKGTASELRHAEMMKIVAGWWEESDSLLVCKPEYAIESVDDTESLDALNLATNVNVVDVVRSVLKGRALEVFNGLVEKTNAD